MDIMDIKNSIIAAVRSEDDFAAALKSDADIIFDLNPDLFSLGRRVSTAHSADKKFFIHVDLATGIGKDKSGLRFIKKAAADGIISTRVNIIKLAREVGLFAIQRAFIVDSGSVETTVQSIKASKADMVEIMPGVVSKIIKKLSSQLDVPLIAGGLVETCDEIQSALENGAKAVSTGNRALWVKE